MRVSMSSRASASGASYATASFFRWLAASQSYTGRTTTGVGSTAWSVTCRISWLGLV